MTPPPPPPPRPRRSNHPDGDAWLPRGIRIVHEDHDVLVVDKPTGLVTADPARAAGGEHLTPASRPGQTLFDILKQYIRNKPGSRRGPPPKLWIIHRLDKEASGLLVFGKSDRAFEVLKDEFKSKKAHRIYLAVIEGELGPPGHTGTRQSMLEDQSPPPSPHHSSRSSPTGRGRDHPSDRDRSPVPMKPAVTHYRVLHTSSSGAPRSLIQVRLETGRKNQIRIHMNELGHPLAGDARFGARTDPIGRLALHASELGFVHPGSGQTVRYRSSAPASFYSCVGAPVQVGGGSDASRSEAEALPPPGVPLPNTPPTPNSPPTSWDRVAGWYDTMLEDRRNDHYEDVILPGTLRLLAGVLPVGGAPRPRVLDVACGQGVLSRRLIERGCEVFGVDASPKLIAAARQRTAPGEPSRYEAADARELGRLGLTGFDAGVCVMALGNIDPLGPVFEGVAGALKPGGVFVAVVSHPAFRVHGRSAWGWDDRTGTQFRRVDAYLSAWAQEIQMHPGKAAAGQSGGEAVTWSFHRPIQAYVAALAAAGLTLDALEEWTSRRASTSGPRAAEENRSREEIPLFMAFRARKIAGG